MISVSMDLFFRYELPISASNPVIISSNSDVIEVWRWRLNPVCSSLSSSSIFFSATYIDASLPAFSLGMDSTKARYSGKKKSFGARR
jgi:hypothetical protein